MRINKNINLIWVNSQEIKDFLNTLINYKKTKSDFDLNWILTKATLRSLINLIQIFHDIIQSEVMLKDFKNLHWSIKETALLNFKFIEKNNNFDLFKNEIFILKHINLLRNDLAHNLWFMNHFWNLITHFIKKYIENNRIEEIKIIKNTTKFFNFKSEFDEKEVSFPYSIRTYIKFKDKETLILEDKIIKTLIIILENLL